MIIRGTLKALRATALGVLFALAVTVGNLLALYIVAGVALRGDWNRINNAIERAYDEFGRK